MTDHRDGRWHGWNGGECPVNPEDVVDVAYNITEPDLNVFASLRKWQHFGGDADIVAFRVVKKAPRVWWVNEYADNRPSYLKVLKKMAARWEDYEGEETYG